MLLDFFYILSWAYEKGQGTGYGLYRMGFLSMNWYELNAHSFCYSQPGLYFYLEESTVFCLSLTIYIPTLYLFFHPECYGRMDGHYLEPVFSFLLSSPSWCQPGSLSLFMF